MKKTFLQILVIVLCMIFVGRQLSFAEETFSLPSADSFDNGTGLPINAGIDNPHWIGSMLVNNDTKHDLVVVDATGQVHMLVNETNSSAAVNFQEVGTAFSLEGEIITAYGDDLDQDGDDDIVFGLQGETMPVLTERISQITSITDTTLVDSQGNWRQDELTGLTLKPNLDTDDEFTITANGGIEMEAENHPLGLAPNTIFVEEGGLLATGARSGDYYSYQQAKAKLTSPNRGEVFLNDGNGAFSQPLCNQELKIPANHLIDKIFTGDFDGDGFVDIVIQHTKYLEGTVDDVSMTMTGFRDLGRGKDFIDDIMDGEVTPYEEDVEVIFTLTDRDADFDANELQDRDINPNIKQDTYFTVSGNFSNTITFSIDLSSSLGLLAAGQHLDSLVRQGDTYRVKVGDSAFEAFKGLGGGCFQSQNAISGENFELDYKQIEVGGVSAARSMLYTPYVNFGAEDSLIGRYVNPASNTDNTELYTIAGNTGTTLYFEPGPNITIFNDRVHTGTPDIFMIVPDDAFVVNDGDTRANRLNFGRIPSEYTALGLDMGDIGPPYKGTVFDLDDDSRDDIVFIANGIFYKRQQ